MSDIWVYERTLRAIRNGNICQMPGYEQVLHTLRNYGYCRKDFRYWRITDKGHTFLNTVHTNE